MIKSGILGAALVCLTAFSATAEAKLYKWVDDNGTTHFGEVVPPEYANKDRVQYNEKGILIKKADPAKDAGSAKKPADDQAAIEQRRKDNALLNTYSNEKEIDLALQRNLQQVEARINSIHLLKRSAQESLDSYRKEVDNYKSANRKIPSSLQNDLAEAEKKIVQLQQDLTQAEAKATSVKAGFAADKARYRELTSDAKK
jgi:hypothetical protein